MELLAPLTELPDRNKSKSSVGKYIYHPEPDMIPLNFIYNLYSSKSDKMKQTYTTKTREDMNLNLNDKQKVIRKKYMEDSDHRMIIQGL